MIISCSFCGKAQSVVDVVISGSTNAFICNECVRVCQKIVTEWDSTKSVPKKTDILYPKKIKEMLDEYIVGQEKAKMGLSVSAFMHALRINNTFSSEVPKSNVLMYGPTGSGKTFLTQIMAKILGVPMVVVDATTLTEAGYVGDDVESVLARLLQSSGYNVGQAEKGIICIDEIDKIARTRKDKFHARDVGGEGVQQALLKLIEGKVASVQKSQSKTHGETIQIDTSNILFMATGAFHGLDDIASKRMNKNRFGMFVSGDPHKNYAENVDVTIEDFVAFGMIPEFISRLSIRIPFHQLSVENLVDIASYGKSSVLEQYKQLLSCAGIKLDISKDVLYRIAQVAYSIKSGARGLKVVFEEILKDRIFNIDFENDNKIINIDESSLDHDSLKKFNI